jgi:hypothetical protein
MKFWRSKGFAFLAAWSDDCFEESNVEIIATWANVKLTRWRPAAAAIANCAVTLD